jgi:hypothetical protein
MSYTGGKSQLHRRLKKLEADRSLKASLLRESETGARELLLERVRAIAKHFDAARERGEEVPTADPEVVKNFFRSRFGLGYRWPTESPHSAGASQQRK